MKIPKLLFSPLIYKITDYQSTTEIKTRNKYPVKVAVDKMAKLLLYEMEFKEFEPRFKTAKTRFELSAGLNLETFDTILSGTNHI